jgi:site-specific recombinase
MSPKAAAFVFRANIFFSFIAGGLLWASGAIPGFAGPTEWAFDLLSWPVNGDPGPLNDAAKFMSAIGGGVLFGLGVLNWLLVAPALETGERRILNAGLASVFSWFIVDSTGSTLSGNAPNVVFNLIILALYVGPILAARRRA